MKENEEAGSMQKRERKSNIELLRLLSMLLIIAHHFSVHGGFYFDSPVVTGNMLFLQLLNLGGKTGVNLFVLISGYFLLEEKKLRLEKAGKLWLQLLFYSVVIYAVACLMGLAEPAWADAWKAAAPVLSEQWWFASTYFVLYLLSPVFNRWLGKLSPKGYRGLLIGVGILFCLVPGFGWLPEKLRNLLWFAYLYALAGFLRRYGAPVRVRRQFLAGTAVFGVMFAYAALLLHFRAGFGGRYETVYLQMYDPLMLLVSMFVFRGFCALELPTRPWINRLAALSFGVYLIHDSNYFRYPLWQGLLRCADFAESPLLIPCALAVVAGVYLVCGLLEAGRQILWRKLARKQNRNGGTQYETIRDQ